jgi:hypothetical protein
LYFAAQSPAGKPALVLEAPGGTWVYPLETGGVVRVPGALGDSVLEIRDGSVRFLDSPCENKICTAHSPLAHNGDWAACLPNRVFARIEGAGDGDFDATAY